MAQGEKGVRCQVSGGRTRFQVLGAGCEDSTAKKDLDFRRTSRLVIAFGKVRQGMRQKQFKNNYVRSRNVYENKQTHDKMPEKSRTFLSKFRTFWYIRHQFCRNSG